MVSAQRSAATLAQRRPASLACFIREKARELGFQAVGFTSAANFDETEQVVLQRIDAGLMAGLDWFTPARARLACRPSDLLPGARSIVALAASYKTDEPDPNPWIPPATRGRMQDVPTQTPDPGPDTTQAGAPALHTGRIARYAWGQDYHQVLRSRCQALLEAIAQELGYHPGARVFVDSSPLVDRAVAQRAAVGWYGKNTNILVHGLGSWAFLAAILLDVDLPDDQPLLTHCGSCDLCIRACPTGALLDPYTLDNQRCISYQTIENRGAIPHELRPLMGDWVFGCDICQDVCPVNRRAQSSTIAEFAPTDPKAARPWLGELLLMDTAGYQDRARGKAVKRAKQRDMQRNAAVALGNTGDRDVVPLLEEGFRNEQGVVRSHIAWAMGNLGGHTARKALETARQREPDNNVRTEIEQALNKI